MQMWDIHDEYPSLKMYTIKCPCLKYDQEPSFVYDDTGDNKGIKINEKQLKALKPVSLAALILKAKQFTSADFKGKYAIFLVEPAGSSYIFHQVRLLNPTKPRENTVDYENIPKVDSTKLNKH